MFPNSSKQSIAFPEVKVTPREGKKNATVNRNGLFNFDKYKHTE